MKSLNFKTVGNFSNVFILKIYHSIISGWDARLPPLCIFQLEFFSLLKNFVILCFCLTNKFLEGNLRPGRNPATGSGEVQQPGWSGGSDEGGKA